MWKKRRSTDLLTRSRDRKARISRKYLFRRFWESALGFWRHGYRPGALGVSLLVVIVLTVGVQYLLTAWNRSFFNALESRDSAAALYAGLLFPALAGASVALWGIAVKLRTATQREWRAWLDNHVTTRWLGEGRYFQLNLIRGEHQNPEYRIAEDLRIATEAPVDFASGVLQALLSAVTFVIVLWTLGGALTISVAGTSVTIPGFLVIGAVIYAAIASGAMVAIGRRYITAAENKNQAEAEYRYVLTRLRENGESIALLGGEDEERAQLDKSLRNVLRRWRDVAVQYMRTTLVSQSSAQISPVIPVLLCAPKYIIGEMSLGEMMQAAAAFVAVQSAFSWLVDNYPRFADWTASARRVASLLVSLDALQRAEEEGLGRIQRTTTHDAALRFKGLSVTLDDGTSVINETEVNIAPGEKVLVVGESGTGKSSLVRAIAGLWPWGGGEIQYNTDAKLFLLPQRAYLPLGTLRRALSYPSAANAFDDKAIADALAAVGLRELQPRLDENAPWDQILSGGEKQRLAFARLILQQPDIVVLDEATSALDPSGQDTLMRLLMQRLPEATLISVGHRPELEQFHDRKLVMEIKHGSAELVKDVYLLSRTRGRKYRWRWRSRGRGAGKIRAA
jgi:vitamin B12/bleomycin/antimicrobial peptide transport system ATP-binding/permease protein